MMSTHQALVLRCCVVLGFDLEPCEWAELRFHSEELPVLFPMGAPEAP